MEILYISSVPSKNQFDYMKAQLKSSIDLAKYGMQESGYKFHTLIIKGLANNKDNNIYSLIGRPVSHSSYKKIFWKRKIEKEENITYNHIGLINIPVLKNLFVSFSYFFKVLNWIVKNKKNDKIIIMDASYVTVLPFVDLATRIVKCKKISIVCDIYEYMADVKDAREKSSKKHKIVSKFMKTVYRNIDGFIFLTEAMNKVINYKNRPYIIMEGLVDINMKNTINNKSKKTDKYVIMYAGALRAQYGLKNLMDAFISIKNSTVELWLYGAGDYTPEIIKCSKLDSRIKFGGILPNSEIVDKEIEADILINPRSANQEFTKYSFPSKNMEYMVSGTPILTTKLPGMPKDYYKYIYTINGNNTSDLKNALELIISTPKTELIKKGLAAKKFVLNQKNNIEQAKRIIEFSRRV